MVNKLIEEWSGHWDMFILLWVLFFAALYFAYIVTKNDEVSASQPDIECDFYRKISNDSKVICLSEKCPIPQCKNLKRIIHEYENKCKYFLEAEKQDKPVYSYFPGEDPYR